MKKAESQEIKSEAEKGQTTVKAPETSPAAPSSGPILHHVSDEKAQL